MTNADLLRQPPGVRDFGARHARTVGGDGDGVGAEGEVGRLGDDGAVDAAAERHGRLADAAQHVQQMIAFGRQVCGLHTLMIRHRTTVLKRPACHSDRSSARPLQSWQDFAAAA